MFSHEGIDAEYTPYPIQHINEVTTLLRRLDGFNVTYPYKQSILPYLSDIDPIAQIIGAVNVVHQGKGYNTDWIGFRDSLRPLLTPHDTTVGSRFWADAVCTAKGAINAIIKYNILCLIILHIS